MGHDLIVYMSFKKEDCALGMTVNTAIDNDGAFLRETLDNVVDN